MKPNTLAALLSCALALATCIDALAFKAPNRAPLPNFDNRSHAAADVVKPTPAQRGAVGKLRLLLPEANVDFDPVSGSPRFVTGGRSFLTGPQGTGKGAAAAALYAFDLNGPAKVFIHSHQDLFGFGPEALDQAWLKRDSTTAHNGVRTVVSQQQAFDIPVFQATLVSHTTRLGELVNLSSGFLPDPETAARSDGTDPATLIVAPPITAAQAVALAARNVGEETKPDQVQTEPAAINLGATKRQQLIGPGLNGKADANLLWVPMGRHSLRLAWEIVFVSHGRSEMFRLLVDAQTGAVLVRHCLTEYAMEATYRVYTNDSPSPFSPGWSSPNSTQPSLVPRQLVTTSALSAVASPEGWIPDTGNETKGNNVDAHTDTNSDDLPDLPRPQGNPARVFDFPIQLATQDPSAYRPAAVVQLFYWNNWIHDKLYELGFTEAAGNFQSSNFGRGGFENDAVQADAQDGSGTDNANFSTPLDGSPPRMQMFIFSRPNPKRDGDLDAEIVLHEYVHGLSNRHVNGGGGLTATQSRGLGEGWSDFYALAFLSQPGDDVNRCYAAGGYTSHQLGGVNDTQNYYFGIRRYPYSTDLTKNPLTFKDIDPAQADYCSSGAPFHSGFFGSCGATSPAEVHNQGEVWCVTLWEVRARLINRYGGAEGNQLILQLVTDGMLYAPGNPDFLEARDAILQADLVNTGGANHDDLWAAFAKRGMGFSATSPSSSTVAGVHEAFDLPDDLRISPATGFTSSGPAGGPFDVNSQTLSLTNLGANSLNWAMSNNAPWLTAAPGGGTLNPGEPASSVQVNLNSTASLLPPGLYDATLAVTNLANGVGQSRAYRLRIGQPDNFTELFEANDNDLSYSSLTFTPDGSASYYMACREQALSFPTDPAGGIEIMTLTDDSFATVTLSGARVSLYGVSNNVFFIGSNGYLTLNSGDNSYEESVAKHFELPRISALFHDQLPVEGTTVISWKQLADRVAVTYQALADIMQTGLNDFQIEWFFDGRIRITFLRVTNHQNLVGLSSGTGLPAGFEDTDLSEVGSCNPLLLMLPYSAAEGAGVVVNAGGVALIGTTNTDVTVTLTSSRPLEVAVPPSITIPAGATLARFNLTIVDDVLLDGTQPTTITASASGYRRDSDTMFVYDNEATALRLHLPATLTEGQGTAEAEVSVSSPLGASTMVLLGTWDTNRLVVPSSVLMLQGQTSAVFTITVIDDFTPNPPMQVAISASVPNWLGALSLTTVLDNPMPIVRVGTQVLIPIPDSGATNPYPSTLAVSAVPGLVSKVTVTITNLFHTYPDDIGILLVGPTGTNVVLMSNAGGGGDLNGTTLTFDDAAGALPDTGQIASGTYRPTAITPGIWPAPAPLPGGSSLTAFNGASPNGTWQLFVYDDSPVDSGRIGDGWFLTFHTSIPPAPRPSILTPFISGPLIHFSFATVQGHTYHVEYLENPPTGTWLPLTSVQGDGTVKNVTDVVAPAQKLYRLRVQ